MTKTFKCPRCKTKQTTESEAIYMACGKCFKVIKIEVEE